MYDHVSSVHKGMWHICEECGKKSCSYHEHKKHTKTHKKNGPVKKIPCPICSILISQNSMKTHYDNIHSDTPLIFCSKCTFSTKYTTYLKVHEAGHTERLQCELCEFSGLTFTDLRRHVKFIHERAELYTCPTCQQKQKGQNRLKKHMKIHLEPSLKCDVCEFKGRTLTNVKQHMLRHEDPKYLCNDCDYKTYDQGNFKTHKTVKHGTEILRCENCDYQIKSKRSLKKHKEKRGH